MEGLIPLDDILLRVTQNDVVHRRHLIPEHRAYIPEFGVYTYVDVDGDPTPYRVSRQAVLFCIERRKSWRMLQSRANIANEDYQSQKMLLSLYDQGKIPPVLFQRQIQELFTECKKAVKEGRPLSMVEVRTG